MKGLTVKQVKKENTLLRMIATFLLLAAIWAGGAQAERIKAGKTEGGPIVVHVVKPIQNSINYVKH